MASWQSQISTQVAAKESEREETNNTTTYSEDILTTEDSGLGC